MQANRIILAAALTGLAGPALAEKCHRCDSSDGPIIVVGGNASQGGAQPAAPGGLAAENDPQARRTGRFGWKDQQAALLNPLDAPGGIAAAGPQPGPRPSVPRVSEILVTKTTDIASPKLMLPLTAGQPVPSPSDIAVESISFAHEQFMRSRSGHHLDLGDYIDEDLPAGLTGEPTTKEGTFFSKVVRAGMEMARREKERQQQAAPLTPLDAPGGLAAAPRPSAAGGGHGPGKVIFYDMHLRPVTSQGSGASPAGSSKPKEIVVVGSKLDTPVGMAATLPQAGATSKGDGRHMLTSTAHDVDRPIVVGRVPQPVAIPVSPAVPRAAGPTALPAKVEFGAAPALRR
jgi:hypothetical protein